MPATILRDHIFGIIAEVMENWRDEPWQNEVKEKLTTAIQKGCRDLSGELLTTEQALKRLADANVPYCSERNLRYLAEDGTLRSQRFGRRRVLRFYKASIDEFIEKYEKACEEGARVQVIIATWPESLVPKQSDRIRLLTESNETAIVQRCRVTLRDTDDLRPDSYLKQFRTNTT